MVDKVEFPMQYAVFTNTYRFFQLCDVCVQYDRLAAGELSMYNCPCGVVVWWRNAGKKGLK